jgi:hypothetical protein
LHLPHRAVTRFLIFSSHPNNPLRPSNLTRRIKDIQFPQRHILSLRKRLTVENTLKFLPRMRRFNQSFIQTKRLVRRLYWPRLLSSIHRRFLHLQPPRQTLTNHLRYLSPSHGSFRIARIRR